MQCVLPWRKRSCWIILRSAIYPIFAIYLIFIDLDLIFIKFGPDFETNSAVLEQAILLALKAWIILIAVALLLDLNEKYHF